MNNSIPSDVSTDLKAVIEHLSAGKPLDESVMQRVLQRSRKAQERLIEKHGVQEIAVELIREGREE